MNSRRNHINNCESRSVRGGAGVLFGCGFAALGQDAQKLDDQSLRVLTDFVEAVGLSLNYQACMRLVLKNTSVAALSCYRELPTWNDCAIQLHQEFRRRLERGNGRDAAIRPNKTDQPVQDFLFKFGPGTLLIESPSQHGLEPGKRPKTAGSPLLGNRRNHRGEVREPLGGSIKSFPARGWVALAPYRSFPPLTPGETIGGRDESGE